MTDGLCPSGVRDDRARLNARLESIVWGLFLMALGIIRLPPRIFW